jgi:hypothetical protein
MAQDPSAVSEQEEFEFRARAEKQRGANKNLGMPAQPKELSFGSKAYALGHGLVTGLVGGPGEIESITTPKLPKTSPLSGHETFFPTQEEVSSGLEKIGISRPSKGTEDWQTVGELAPAILGGGTLVYKGGKYALSKGGKILSEIKGKPLEEALSSLKQSLTGTSGQAASAIEQQAKQRAEQLPKEAVQRRAAQRSVVRQLETGAERAKAESASELNKIAKPKDEYRLGQELREKVSGVQGELQQAANKAAAELKMQYLNEGKAKEEAGQYWSQSVTGKEFLKSLREMVDPKNFGKYDTYERQAAQNLLNELQTQVVGGQDLTMQGLTGVTRAAGKVVRAELPKIESVIRKTKKLPSGPTQYGAEAQVQQAMGKLASKLEDSVYGYVDEAGREIEGFAPTGRQFRNVYREMMTPLNAYESPVGKVLTQEVEGLKGIFSSDATAIPGAVFKSPQQIQTLERMGVKKSTLEPYAEQYTANKLAKFNKAEDVAKWLQSTESAYLREFPDLTKKAEQYAQTFAKNEQLAAGKSKAAEAISEFAQRGTTQLRDDVSKLKQMSEASQKEITDGLYKVMNAKDTSSIASQARTYVLNLKNKGHIQEGEANQLLTQIREVETKIKDRAKAIDTVKRILPFAAGAVGLSGLSYVVKPYIGGM